MHNLRHFALFDPSYASRVEHPVPCLSSIEYHATGVAAQPSHRNIWLPCPSTTAKQSPVAPPSCDPAPCAVGPSPHFSTKRAAGQQPVNHHSDGTAGQHAGGRSFSDGMTDIVYIPAHLQRPHAPLRCQPHDFAVSALLAQSALAAADPNLLSILRVSEAALEDLDASSVLHGSGFSQGERLQRGGPRGTALPPSISNPQAKSAPSAALEEVCRQGSRTGGLFRAGVDGRGGRKGSAAAHRVRRLRSISVLTGFQEDWLELAPAALRLWDKASLEPYGAPKALITYLLCPEDDLPASRQLLRDVSAAYDTCRLGSHTAAADGVIPYYGGDGWRASLQAAVEKLQRRLLLQPPPVKQLSGGLEDEFEAAVVVYVIAPSGEPDAAAAALVDAACTLAPVTAVGMAACRQAAFDAALDQQRTSHKSMDQCDAGKDGNANFGGDVGCAAIPAGSMAEVITQGGKVVGAVADQAVVSTPPITDQIQLPHKRKLPFCEAAEKPSSANTVGDSAPVAWPGSKEGDKITAEERGGTEKEAISAEARYCGAARNMYRLAEPPAKRRATYSLLSVQSQPLNLVLQVVSRGVLADISGEAARAMAWAVYSKVQRSFPSNACGSAAAAAPAAELASGPSDILPDTSELPKVLHEPLMVLGEDSGRVSDSCGDIPSAGGVSERSLHCSYAWCGERSVAALSWTDCRGELMHCRLLELPGLDADCVEGAEELCREVLSTTLKVWADMQAAAGSRTGARQIIISRSGTMPTTEAGAWVAIVARLYQPQMGCQRPEQLSVVSVAVESMTRLTTASDTPAGAFLVLDSQSPHQPPLLSGTHPATTMCSRLPRSCHVLWLPPADGAAALLPGEADAVRSLGVQLVAHYRQLAAEPASPQPRVPGESSHVKSCAEAVAVLPELNLQGPLEVVVIKKDAEHAARAGEGGGAQHELVSAPEPAQTSGSHSVPTVSGTEKQWPLPTSRECPQSEQLPSSAMQCSLVTSSSAELRTSQTAAVGAWPNMLPCSRDPIGQSVAASDLRVPQSQQRHQWDHPPPPQQQLLPHPPQQHWEQQRRFEPQFQPHCPTSKPGAWQSPHPAHPPPPWQPPPPQPASQPPSMNQSRPEGYAPSHGWMPTGYISGRSPARREVFMPGGRQEGPPPPPWHVQSGGQGLRQPSQEPFGHMLYSDINDQHQRQHPPPPQQQQQQQHWVEMQRGGEGYPQGAHMQQSTTVEARVHDASSGAPGFGGQAGVAHYAAGGPPLEHCQPHQQQHPHPIATSQGQGAAHSQWAHPHQEQPQHWHQGPINMQELGTRHFGQKQPDYHQDPHQLESMDIARQHHPQAAPLDNSLPLLMPVDRLRVLNPLVPPLDPASPLQPPLPVSPPPDSPPLHSTSSVPPLLPIPASESTNHNPPGSALSYAQKHQGGSTQTVADIGASAEGGKESCEEASAVQLAVETAAEGDDAMDEEDDDDLTAATVQVATELYRLGCLNAAYYGMAMAPPSAIERGGLGFWGWAPSSAHLPLHVAAAQRLLVLSGRALHPMTGGCIFSDPAAQF